MKENGFSPASGGHRMLHFQERPAASGTAGPGLLVLMHGVGSHEDDLMALAPWVGPAWHVVSLRAPHALGPGSHAWFAFQVRPDGTRRIDTAQEAASRVAVAHTVQALAAARGVPPSRTVLGGFSQGAILALSLLRTRPELMRAALVLHGRLLPEVDALAAPAAALQDRDLWVSHGRQDTVIPPASAAAIRAWAARQPLRLAGGDYPGGHGVHPQELADAVAWLNGLRPASDGLATGADR